MKKLDSNWADKIWEASSAINLGDGAAWILSQAVLAVTGARPASLEKGIEISYLEKDGKHYIQAKILGVKLRGDRGQPWYCLLWDMKSPNVHRKKEFRRIIEQLMKTPNYSMVIKYDAEGISTRLRELSKSLWPRRAYHVSAYSYRELFSSAAKASGVDKNQLAMAMGHLSEASQRQYHGRRRASTGGVTPPRPFNVAYAAKPVKAERPQMSRFKAMTARKNILKANKLKTSF